MAAYWGLFSIFALGALFGHGRDANRRAGLLLGISMILLALFVGLRWEVGPDWPTYRALFRFLHDDGFGEVIGKSDPGFRSLVMVLQWQHAPFWVLNLICACIFSFGLARFCTVLPNPWLAVLVAVPYLVIVIAMSALRQATAIGFIFLALRDMGTKPLWRSILWVLIASLFHASAFVVAVLIALSYAHSRAQAVILLIASSIPAYYVLFGTFDLYLRRYGQHRIDSGGVAFRVAMNAVPAVILLVRGSKHFAPRGEEAFWRSLAILSLALVPAMLYVKSTTVIDRLSIYAIPLQILVLSGLPGQFSTSSATRIYVVVADDLVPVPKERVGQVAAEETRDAGDEDTLLRHGPLWSIVEEVKSGIGQGLADRFKAANSDRTGETGAPATIMMGTQIIGKLPSS